MRDLFSLSLEFLKGQSATFINKILNMYFHSSKSIKNKIVVKKNILMLIIRISS